MKAVINSKNPVDLQQLKIKLVIVMLFIGVDVGLIIHQLNDTDMFKLVLEIISMAGFALLLLGLLKKRKLIKSS